MDNVTLSLTSIHSFKLMRKTLSKERTPSGLCHENVKAEVQAGNVSLLTASLQTIIENRERSTKMLTAYAGNTRNMRILNRTTGVIIVKTKRRMIRTLFRVINLHPMQIRITSQAIRKSLKRTSPSGESHRAIVHLNYILSHSAHSYLSLFRISKIAQLRRKVKRSFEIRLGYYFFPTDSKEELPAKTVCKGSENRAGLPRAGGATEDKAPRESLQAVCMPAGIGRGTGDAKGLGYAQARIKCQDKMPGKAREKYQGKMPGENAREKYQGKMPGKNAREKCQGKMPGKNAKKKGTRLSLVPFFVRMIRAGAGACVRTHAPSWALRARSTFISSQRTKDNRGGERAPKQGALNGKSKASKKSSNVRTETSITLHSKDKEVNQCRHLLHKGLKEYRYQTGQGGAPEP